MSDSIPAMNAIASLTNEVRALSAQVKTLSPQEPPRLLDDRAVAKTLGVSARTVFELRKLRQLRSVEIGARKLVSIAALNEFIAAREA